ncbi:MAG TPA: hypothetical protein VJN43_20320 [Bryobacteraceae bacterium]|nr:hypothetical protein [Bryobacteraceae bacterium]
MKNPLSTVFTFVVLIGATAGIYAQPNFVYTNDDVIGGNTVSGFSIDSIGNLTPLANSPFATGGGGAGGGGFAVNRIVIGGGKYLYASNSGTADVSAFAIDPATGALNPVAGSPFPVGGPTFADISLAASPDGQFLFAGVTSNNTVVTLKVMADGSLSQAASLAIPAAPSGMKVTPDGKFLAAALPGYLGFGAIAMFAIASDGSLTMVNGVPFIGTGTVAGIDVNCAGTQLFGGVMTRTGAAVDAYSIGAGGILTRMRGSPYSPGVGTNSNVVLLSPNDQLLFVGNQFSNSVTSITVSASGTLGLVAGSPFAIGGQSTFPSGMATDAAGSFLYVASQPNFVQVFQIAVDGTLTPVAGSPFSTAQPAGLLSLTAFPGKTCNGAGAGSPPPPPVITGLPSEGCTLWPPQKQLVQVATITAGAEAGLASFDVAGTSNEPSDPNNPDIVITGTGLGPRTVQLRADRLGTGTGRVYTLTATATDTAGTTVFSTATCTVPHDQGN